MTTLYNRASYWLFVLEIPHVRGKELLSAVKIKLTSLLPALPVAVLIVYALSKFS